MNCKNRIKYIKCRAVVPQTGVLGPLGDHEGYLEDRENRRQFDVKASNLDWPTKESPSKDSCQ